MLDIRVVEGIGTVDTFGAQLWTHNNAATLQFFDTRYAQSGWHNMSEFVVEYYDGVGYDGEPLKVVEQASTADQSPDVVWLNNLTPTGGNSQFLTPDTLVTDWRLAVYGEWSKSLKANATIPNVDPSWRPFINYGPLNVVCLSSYVGTETEGTASSNYQVFVQNMGKNAILIQYEADAYSLHALVDDVACIQEYFAKAISSVDKNQTRVGNLVIVDHGRTPEDFMDSGSALWVGNTQITPDTLVYRWSSLNQALGFQSDFFRLGSVMIDDGQIQHFACRAAGANSMNIPTLADGSLGPDGEKLQVQSFRARQMLGTIANLTHSTVFASSDSSVLIASFAWEETLEKGMHKVNVGDLCLEFGIDKWGAQVSYVVCNQQMWNIEYWRPIGGGGNAEHGLQTLWDMRSGGDNPWVINGNGEVATPGEVVPEGVSCYYGFLPYYRPFMV